MECEHLPARFQIGGANVHELIKTSRPSYCRVDLLRLVRGCNDEDVLFRATIQVSEELVHFLRLILLVAAQSLS